MERAPPPGDGRRVVMATPDFGSLVRELHAGNIYVGLQTAAYGMMVWIADRYARHRKDVVIEFNSEAGAWDKTASEWVHAMALKVFPDSPYAQRHGKPGTRRRH
jgi:hypothetical protein